jgi:hypothetical protein
MILPDLLKLADGNDLTPQEAAALKLPCRPLLVCQQTRLCPQIAVCQQEISQ